MADLRGDDYTCEDYGTETEWLQVRVTVKLEMLETLTSVMSMIDDNLMIEDYSDIDLSTCYGDLIDEKILNADKTVASVSVFLPASGGCREQIDYIKSMLDRDGIDGDIRVNGVKMEDWANNWRKYYKSTKIGEKIVIVPAWEDYQSKDGEIIVRMDPGMAFGTGTHETTRLVIRLLEKYTKPGQRMLDVGTGSGILAICASKLGAKLCRAYDLDPTAVEVARENIANDGAKNVTCDQSDLVKSVDVSDGKYDLVCANIVADILIRMSPDVGATMNEGAVILTSGIIRERADDVIRAYVEKGYTLIDRLDDNGWCALAFKK